MDNVFDGIDFSEYSMKLIEYLGKIRVGGKLSKFAMMECGVCKKAFRIRLGSVAAQKQKSCIDCRERKVNGLSRHPLYAVWSGMLGRCYNPKRKDYKSYGGKGVTVCQEWKSSFILFYNWCIDNGWEHGLSLDKDTKSKELGITPTYSPDTVIFMCDRENSALGKRKAVIQYTLEMEIISEFDSTVSAVLSLGKVKSAKTSVANCCRGVTNSAFGFIWRYK